MSSPANGSRRRRRARFVGFILVSSRVYASTRPLGAGYGHGASDVTRQAHAGHLPARPGRKEVAVGAADVPRGRQARASAQDVLAAHELAVVLAERPAQRPEPWIGRVAARGPLPDIAEQLGQLAGGGAVGMQPAAVCEGATRACVRRGVLPLGLARQTRAEPARDRVGLVQAQVTGGLARIDRAHAGELVERVFAVAALPVQRRLPALALHDLPAIAQP